MLADHEDVGSDLLEPVTRVEAAGAMIFGEYGEIELGRAAPARRFQRPVHQRLRDPGAVPGLAEIELAELGRGAGRRDRQRDGAQLRIAREPAVFLRDAECEGG